MAETTKDNEKPQPPSAPATSTDQLAVELAALKAELAALRGASNIGLTVAQVQGDPGEKATETIPGGAYLLADGKTLVNAYGRKIDKSGKPLSNDDAHLERALR
jgi:hypothetical protein